MTEPSKEALKAAADALPVTWARKLVNDVALAMDALTEQRVAAERERCARVIQTYADIADPGWQTQQKFNLMLNAIRAPADRPAPEGAAPTADLARPRCSTKRALRNSTAESSPTQTVAAPGPTAGRSQSTPRMRRNDEMHGYPPAGDVERAREICEPLLYQRPCTGDDIENPGLLLWRRDYDKLVGETAAALQVARAEARAELLAQIEEPLREAVAWAIHDAPLPPHDNNLAIRGLLATAALRALADKLTDRRRLVSLA